MGKSKPTVFISHGSTEVEYIHELKTYLELIFPSVNFFTASSLDSLKLGKEWWNEIKDSLSNARIVLACISRVTSDKLWVLFESGFGLGCGAVIIPIILDDLPISKLVAPLSMFQGINLDEAGLNHLIQRISQIIKIQAKEEIMFQKPLPIFIEKQVSMESSMGVYLGGNRHDMAYGWQCYAGDSRNLEICKGYLNFGKSWNDGFRYPPTDSLLAPWRYFGCRVKIVKDLHVYVTLKCIDNSTPKIYISSLVGNWGFTAYPTDEYRIPAPSIAKGRWHVFIIDITSLENKLDSPIKGIIGFRVRGPLMMSHIWCANHLENIPEEYRKRSTIISYPG